MKKYEETPTYTDDSPANQPNYVTHLTHHKQVRVVIIILSQ